MDRARTLRPSNSETDVTVFTIPLLTNGNGSNHAEDQNNIRYLPRRTSIRGAAHFLRRASSRRMMREPSRLVRETAADQLEETQTDWAYSRPVVVLDLVWNLVFVIIAVAVLVLSANESPRRPLRVWIVGYALQCSLHMVCVWFEYIRRRAEISRGDHGNSGVSAVSDEEVNDTNGDTNVEEEAGDTEELPRERASSGVRISLAFPLLRTEIHLG
eukprot:Gb_36319 [translate_table: standard]